jgi:SAM-dependent methyltransferase
MFCNICKKEFEGPLYESPDDFSITTMNKLVPGKTRVYYCRFCGHLQTSELPNLKDYYAHEYEINLASEDDDQIYRVVDGKPVFRADHQATVLLSKANLFPGCRVLDYGCAKAPTLKKVLAVHPDIEAFLFDVTDKYVPFWRRFPKQPSWSVHEPDPAWSGTLDVVLSFYALEHVADLHSALTNVKSLLKPGGMFYFIVPNVYANTADFIVADHINHFSPGSLRELLARNGFDEIDVDAASHDAAFVVTARVKTGNSAKNEEKNFEEAERYSAAREMARYWSAISRRIREFETGMKTTDVVAIYGAGFYGNLIASLLANPRRVACFVDQNPHLQGSIVCGKKVLPPRELPPEVTHVIVGLNPQKARFIIDSIESWRGRKLSCFYL